MFEELDRKMYEAVEVRLTNLVLMVHNDYMKHLNELTYMGLYSDIEDIDPIDRMLPDEYFSHLILTWIVTRRKMLVRNVYLGTLKPMIRKITYYITKHLTGDVF